LTVFRCRKGDRLMGLLNAQKTRKIVDLALGDGIGMKCGWILCFRGRGLRMEPPMQQG
jgi:hypothetical protein